MAAKIAKRYYNSKIFTELKNNTYKSTISIKA